MWELEAGGLPPASTSTCIVIGAAIGTSNRSPLQCSRANAHIRLHEEEDHLHSPTPSLGPHLEQCPYQPRLGFPKNCSRTSSSTSLPRSETMVTMTTITRPIRRSGIPEWWSGRWCACTGRKGVVRCCSGGGGCRLRRWSRRSD